MKNLLLSSLMLGVALSASSTTCYITPDGNKSNDGSSFEKAKELVNAISSASAGDSLILQSGTYLIPYTEGSKNTITCQAVGAADSHITVVCPDGMATIDFQFPELAWVQNSFGLSVTGDYWEFRNLVITHAGYQGAYVTGGYNTFNHCIFYDNRNSGLEINKGGHHTTVRNCDAYLNYDPKKGGSMADGFAPKQTQGAGNNFHGCRAWLNGDDGYDCFDSPEAVTFDSCWAFCNGIDVWHYSGDDVVAFAGNGNGFKLGGNKAQANNVATRCISFGHPMKGFDQNNNTGGITLYNCISYANGLNYGMGGTLNDGQQHVVRNCISWASQGSVADLGSASEDHNSWDKGFSVSESDFLSLDTSLATVARNADGSLPEMDLFRLRSTSSLVDAGTDVGLAYKGKNPDLGPYEVVTTTATLSFSANPLTKFIDNQILLSSASDVTIYDVQGRYLQKITNTMCVDLRPWNKGVYVVMIEDNPYKVIVK